MAVERYQPVIGALAGGVEALRAANGSAGTAVAETLGGAVAGLLGTCMYAAAVQQQQRVGSVRPGVVTLGSYGALSAETVLEWQASLRSLAHESMENARAADSELARLGYTLVELFLHLLAGAAVGLPAGYISQLALYQGKAAPLDRLSLPPPVS